jgi:F-type H+-transporting ATPase subunit b
MQRLFLLSWLFIIFVLCWVGSAQAAPEGGGHAAPNAMEFRYDTALWSFVVFVLLLLILGKYAWPPILEGLKKREETIRSSIEEAKKTRTEMEQLRDRFHKEMAEAQQQIPRLMEDARKKAEEMSNEIRAKAVADIQTERERLRHELEIGKDQALKEIWEQAAQLATLISAKAIGRSLSEDDHRRLLDEAMAEMRRPGHN